MLEYLRTIQPGSIGLERTPYRFSLLLILTNLLIAFPGSAHSATCITEGSESYEFINFNSAADCSSDDCTTNIYSTIDCSGSTVADANLFFAPYCESDLSSGGTNATQCAGTTREDINWSYSFASGRTGVFFCGAANVPTFTVANNNTAPIVDCTSRFISIRKIQDGSENTNSPSTDASFIVSVDPPIAASEAALTVDLSYGGTATSAVDYAAGPTSITINPGESDVFLDLAVIKDSESEGTETIIVEVSNPSNGAINSLASAATADLTDAATCFVEGNQSFQVINFVDEGDCNSDDCIAAVYDTTTCSGNQEASANIYTAPYCLNVDSNGGTSNTQCAGTNSEDTNWSFSFNNNRTGVFFCGASSIPTFTVAANNTAPTLNCSSGYAPGRISITKNVDALEDNNLIPTIPGEFIVSIDPAIPANESAITVDIAYSGTATNGVDYQGPVTITIQPGESTALLFIDIIEDAIFEGTETITATISNATSGTIDPFQNLATMNLLDDDSMASAKPTNIPVFGPFGLLAVLMGLLWFGNQRRKS